MKKKLLSGFALLAIAAVAAWNVNFNSQKNLMSDIALSNVEALASESGAGRSSERESPWNTVTHKCEKLNYISCPKSGM